MSLYDIWYTVLLSGGHFAFKGYLTLSIWYYSKKDKRRILSIRFDSIKEVSVKECTLYCTVVYAKYTVQVKCTSTHSATFQGKKC